MHVGKSAMLKESRRHGDDLFPLGLYYMDLPPGETVVDYHWHAEAEFLYVVHGGTMFQIGEQLYPVRKGEAVFVHGGDIHAGFPLGDDGCCFYAIVFDMNWLQSSQYDFIQNEYMLPLLDGHRSLPLHYNRDTAWKRNVLTYLERLINVLKSKANGFPLAVKSELYSILFEIANGDHWITRDATDAERNSDLYRLKQVLRYIENHYDQKIELRDLAAITHMSAGHFCRFFKAMTRKTSIEYINSYRIARAAELLKRSERKISDIAHDVGFDNISYFIKKFKQQIGCTPNEYRRNHREHTVPIPF